jgi:hypothetical protein
MAELPSGAVAFLFTDIEGVDAPPHAASRARRVRKLGPGAWRFSFSVVGWLCAWNGTLAQFDRFQQGGLLRERDATLP